MFDFSFHDVLLQWGVDGLVNASWWQVVLYTLLLTHITIASVTIFLHRAQAHRSLELHAIPSHFFRFWLWLTTATVTKQWVAVHRKHHAKCETAEDPHSPVAHGIKTVLLRGRELYAVEAASHAVNRTGIDRLQRLSTVWRHHYPESFAVSPTMSDPADTLPA